MRFHPAAELAEGASTSAFAADSDVEYGAGVIDPLLPYSDQLRQRADAVARVCVRGPGPAGEPGGHSSGPLDAPIVMSSAFAFESAEHAARAFRGDNDALIYGRWANPTTTHLEQLVAALEGAESACVTASGMAAIAGVLFSICEAGSHIVAPRSMYAESARLLRERLPRFGVTTTFVDPTAEGYAAAITGATRILYVETPANPTLRVVDIAAIAEVADAAQIAGSGRPAVVVDGTFATPFAQTPLALGADLVVHSMTKGISGHGDVIAGAIAGSRARIEAARDVIVKGFGGVLSPLTAWLVARGIRTFALRQARACETATHLARSLAAHPGVRVVNHPSLPTHPDHAVAARQMHAYGALLSFELAGPDAIARGARLLESLELATHAVSLGDVRTLVVHPASTTHSTMPPEARRLAHVSDGLLRVSVGLEPASDLAADFTRALDQLTRTRT